MTAEEMKSLRTGDLVRHRSGSESCVVTDNFRGRVTAVRSFDITNPDEWEVVSKAGGSPSAAASAAPVSTV